MDSFFELLGYSFFQNAMLAALFTSISCGIIGAYIVAKRIVFISGGITHASFGGIGIGYYFGFSPIIGAMLFSVFSALGIEYLSKKSEIREDSVIAMLWSLGMAIGIIFIFLTPGYSANLMSYLFGNILTVSKLNIYFLGVLCMVLLGVFYFMFKTILFVAFDEDFARAIKLPVEFTNYMMMVLVALTIVLNIRVVGIILVISLLTIPQTIAGIYSKDFKKIIWLSVIVGFVGSIVGLLISYFFNIPSGASIIFFMVVLYILAKTINSLMVSSKLKKQLN